MEIVASKLFEVLSTTLREIPDNMNNNKKKIKYKNDICLLAINPSKICLL